MVLADILHFLERAGSVFQTELLGGALLRLLFRRVLLINLRH